VRRREKEVIGRDAGGNREVEEEGKEGKGGEKWESTFSRSVRRKEGHEEVYVAELDADDYVEGCMGQKAREAR
jgi:hypothetical protein